jgi:nitrogenase subunit NifH
VRVPSLALDGGYGKDLDFIFYRVWGHVPCGGRAAQTGPSPTTTGEAGVIYGLSSGWT